MRIAHRTLLIILAKSAEQACSFFLVLLLARLLTRDSLGTYRQAMMIYAFLGGVLAANLPDSMYYFVPKYTGAQRKLVVGQTGVLLFILAVVTCGVMFVFAPQFASSMHNPELEAFLRVVSLFPLSQLLIRLVSPVLISLDKAWPSAVFAIITNVVRVVSVGAPIALGRDLVFAGYCLVISSAVMAAFGIAILFFHSRCLAFGWNRVLLREQFSYVLPLAAAGLVGIMGRTLDKFIISFYFEPGEYAAYANGAIELPLIGILTTSLAAAIMPDLVRYGKEGKFDDILRLWNTAARKCALVIFPVFVLILMVSSDIIVLLFTDKYTDSVYSFRVYLFVLPVRIAIFGTVLRAVAGTRVILYAAVAALIFNFVVSVALVVLGKGSLLSFIGPAIGTVAAVWVADFYQLRQIKKICQTKWSKVMAWTDLSKILLLALFAGVCSGLCKYLLDVGPWWEVGIPAGVFMLVYFFAGWITGIFNESDLRYLRLRPFKTRDTDA